MNRLLAKVFMVGLILCFGAVAMADDQPAFNVNWYGAVKVDGSYDKNLTSHGNFSMWVEEQTVDESDQQFNMTANATRLGIKADNNNKNKFDINGQLEFDLFAGSFGPDLQENNPMLQLRHAFLSIARDNLKVVAGQTNDLVSPLDPSMLNYASLWGCGNIGYRRPQISMSYTHPAAENTNVTMAGGFFRTIGSDLTPTFSLAANESRDATDDGTDAAIPSMQALVEINHQSPSGTYLRMGVSGLYGKLRAETNLGNSQTYESWAASGHMMIATPSNMGISGEIYFGANLQSYMGSVLNESQINGLNTVGGWVSGWIQPQPQIRINAGMGIDAPDNEELTGDRFQNRCVFTNVNYNLIPELTVGFEVSHWETRYANDQRAENVRAQTSLSLNF